MAEAARYKHSGDLGDLVYALPAVRHMGGGTVVLNTAGLGQKYDGTASGITPKLAEMLTPLLLAQPYVSGVEVWDGGPVDVDLDDFRDGRNYDRNNLCHMVLDYFGVPRSAAESPWLTVPHPRREASAVFARSLRYRNDGMEYGPFLERHRSSIFVGLSDEHADFTAAYGPIRHRPVRDFLEFAALIAGADFVMSNQTLAMAIAVGLGRDYVQETCPRCPNCVFDRAGATHLLGPLPPARNGKVGRAKRQMLAEGVLRTAMLPGEMAEVGVYTGGSAMAMASACPWKTLHLFDTFSGIPEKGEHDKHRVGDFGDAKVEEVREYLSGQKVDFHVGVFPGTTSAIRHGARFSFVHLDGDTYRTTSDGIRYFAPRMVDGGIIAFDDWEWHATAGVKKAVLEHFDVSDVRVSVSEEPRQAWVRFPAEMHGGPRDLRVPMI